MTMEDVYVVSDKLRVTTDVDVVLAQTQLGTQFPNGYRDYVTTLGTGYCNDYIRVLLPAEVLSDLGEARERWAMFAPSRYKEGRDLLPLERMVESIMLLDTIDGDEAVFHPDAPNALYVLPRQDEQIYEIGHTLNDALTWLLSAHVLAYRERISVLMPTGEFVTRPIRYFVPDVEREVIGFTIRKAYHAALRAHLITLAHTTPGPTLCLRRSYAGYDGIEGEVLQLFVREYGGEIVCDPFDADSLNVSVRITHDAGSHAPSLDDLLTYIQSLMK